MKPERNKNLAIAFFACIFLVMLTLNFLTPIVSDDFAHYYGAVDGSHIDTLTKIFPALKEFRQNINGRVVAHFFVFLMLMLPRGIFCVVNAIVSTAIPATLLQYYCPAGNKKKILLLCSSVMLLWIFTPRFGAIYLWLTGACNYSWGLLLDVVFLYPFFCAFTGKDCRTNQPSISVAKILYLVLAVITGAYSESGSFGTLCAAALFGLAIWMKDKKFPVYLFLVFSAGIVGFAFLILAPATINTRIAESRNLLYNAQYCISMMKQYYMVPLIIYTVVLTISVSNRIDCYRILSSVFLVLGGFASILCFVFAAYLPERSFMLIISFTILAIMILASGLMEKEIRQQLSAAFAALVVVFVFSFTEGAGDIYSLYRQASRREQTIAAALAAGDMEVEIPGYETDTIYPAACEEELSEDASYWYNDFVAQYYGVESVVRCEPEE